ncbi:MAG: hypothetical protein KF878_00315 [Planctomycetes bacterium]|nr:hypothetical protein [Planctomycetota bacterium]
MRVTLPEVDDLELYDFEKIAHKAGLGVATVKKHRLQPACPLYGDAMRQVPGSRKACCEPATVRAYLAWLWDRGKAVEGVDSAPRRERQQARQVEAE